jgi:hypothetical protein
VAAVLPILFRRKRDINPGGEAKQSPDSATLNQANRLTPACGSNGQIVGRHTPIPATACSDSLQNRVGPEVESWVSVRHGISAVAGAPGPQQLVLDSAKGIKVAPVFTYSSGHPFNLLLSFDANNDSQANTDARFLPDAIRGAVQMQSALTSESRKSFDSAAIRIIVSRVSLKDSTSLTA